MKAMVVDDSKAMRMIIGRIIKSCGFEVAAEASNGRQALERLEEGDIELLLLDWNMPEMTGLEVVKAVRSDSRHDETRILMVTTESHSAHVADALDSGANGYLAKPFTAEALLEELRMIGVG